jgi:hypothetical protein
MQNNEMICQFGHEFGFVTENFNHGMSIKDIADIHFNILKAILLSKDNLDRLITAGSNMFVVWRGIRWSRLYEKDIKPKRFLLDGAQELDKAGFAKEKAAIVMILLIAVLYDFEIDPDWLAHNKPNGEELPEAVLNKIKPLLNN